MVKCFKLLNIIALGGVTQKEELFTHRLVLVYLVTLLITACVTPIISKGGGILTQQHLKVSGGQGGSKIRMKNMQNMSKDTCKPKYLKIYRFVWRPDFLHILLKILGLGVYFSKPIFGVETVISSRLFRVSGTL